MHVAYRQAREKSTKRPPGRTAGAGLDPGKKRGGLWWTYVCSLVFKAGVDATFLYVFHSIYPRYTLPPRGQVPRGPVSNVVECFISKPEEKNIFTLFI